MGSYIPTPYFTKGASPNVTLPVTVGNHLRVRDDRYGVAGCQIIFVCCGVCTDGHMYLWSRVLAKCLV